MFVMNLKVDIMLISEMLPGTQAKYTAGLDLYMQDTYQANYNVTGNCSQTCHNSYIFNRHFLHDSSDISK